MCSVWFGSPASLPGWQLEKRMNSLGGVLTLRGNRRTSESLVANKRPPSVEVSLNSLPRCQILLRRCMKSITDSSQSDPAVWTSRRVIQRLVGIANSPVGRSLENLPAVETDKRCGELLLHARHGAD